MSYADATAFAASLATTLMARSCVPGRRRHPRRILPAAEFDGDDDMVSWAGSCGGKARKRPSSTARGRVARASGLQPCDDPIAGSGTGNKPGQRGRVRAVRP